VNGRGGPGVQAVNETQDAASGDAGRAAGRGTGSQGRGRGASRERPEGRLGGGRAGDERDPGRRRRDDPGALGGPDEREIVARARRGDHAAFRVLVERYGDRIHRLAMRVLRDEEAARDAAQEIFLKAYGALHRFEGRSRFYTWLYRLGFNLCLDLKRRDRSDRHVELEEERAVATDPAPSAPGSPGRELERSELGRHIARAVEGLPEEARQTLLLREVDGLAYAEIAEVLGIPKGTVMSRLHYARKRVREALEAEGIRPGGAAGPDAPRGGEGA